MNPAKFINRRTAAAIACAALLMLSAGHAGAQETPALVVTLAAEVFVRVEASIP